LRLLNGGDGIGEELIQQRGVPQPQPGHNDNGHYDLLSGRAFEVVSESFSSCQL
jgi:hypothetical protein